MRARPRSTRAQIVRIQTQLLVTLVRSEGRSCAAAMPLAGREHRKTAQTPQYIKALSLPNVVPEGLEHTTGCADILMPWGVTWHREVPTLSLGPWVLEPLAAEPV